MKITLLRTFFAVYWIKKWAQSLYGYWLAILLAFKIHLILTKVILQRLLKYTGFVQSLGFLQKSSILSSYFPDLEKARKIDEVWKKWKKVLSFFLSYNKCFISDLFFLFLLSFFKSFSTSPVCLQGTMKKALFLHLFDKTLSMEKEIFVLQKGLENVFNFGSKNCANPELLSTATSMSEIIYV